VLDFQPSKEGYEAGIVVWWSMFSYASIGITRTTTEAGLEERVVVLNLPTEEIGVMTVSLGTLIRLVYPLLTFRTENRSKCQLGGAGDF